MYAKASIVKLLVLVLVCFRVTGAYPPSFDIPLDPQILLKNDLDKEPHGAVASESKYCSERGIEMLTKTNKNGDKGTAADVMVATVLCVGVVSMYHSGIGGGGFMVIRNTNGEYESIDFRETAPAAAYNNMFSHDRKASIFGGLASGVPGELRGLEYLLRTHGRLDWHTVASPAIEAAEKGVPVTKDLLHYMDLAEADGEFLTKGPWKEVFAPDGKRVDQGGKIKRGKYAKTLREIAHANSVEPFYSGVIANDTVRAVQAAGGIMTVDDLKNYHIEHREPLKTTYRNHTLVSTGAPASGAVALNILKVLEKYNFADSADQYLNTHLMVEAMKFGYGMRQYLGDPDFDAHIKEYQQKMLEQSTVDTIRGKISDDTTHDASWYTSFASSIPTGGGTSHLVAADDSGLAISLITSVNLYFGSRVMVPETGIIMNNGMNDFSISGFDNEFGIPPSPQNYILAHKRPQSSMSPLIVTGPDNFTFLTGSAGGSRITTATVQNTIHAIDEKLTAQEALAQPRLHNQLFPCSSYFEAGAKDEDDKYIVRPYNGSIVGFMASLGHNVTWVTPGQSTAQALRWHNGKFDAGGEPRQHDSGYAIW
ncbi:gamma-glutamyltransferase family protein [Aspergillus udagawae]|uniref:Glutathione hydrolase n=1 Tax=Aspergillus udagawae TaxID=91492 RepID=A0A8E0V2J7_9EURO|nr:uncharacterized protein Aud_002051 [Aspergillus udagawae]GIC94722.1 hypothetical protein Aud_002051 [Aspergillus udagawae]